jgi:uncharacterized protein (TIGR02722 family)
MKPSIKDLTREGIMNKYLALAALSLPLLYGCSGTQVKRIDTGAVVDLSGRWNDTDARLSAEELVADCISKPWLAAASTGTSMEPPTVIVGTVDNQTSEHINTGLLVENLQRALINSGKVTFVASKAERANVRGERLDQDTNASEDTKKANGQELGADYMLSGSISSIEDREGGKAVVLYQVDMKLLNVKTNQISWSGQKQIKKFVKRSGSSW